MENTTFINENPTQVQFLSVCHYINTFGIFFFNHDLIAHDERNHSVSVLNTFFQYIENSANETEAKVQLLERVLRRSDLYGGGENETLDMKYVEETYQYIISNALFSHYGNIEGFLARIISRANNITYFSLKENVLNQFSTNYESRDYCSSRNESIALANLTIEKVFNEHLWSMFPEPEENIDIMDVHYIYAMIGLKSAKFFQIDHLNLTFENFIHLSRGIELAILDNETYEFALELFEAPALFYYASIETESFSSSDIKSLMNSDTFWQKVYKQFFQFLHLAIENMVKKNFISSLYFKLEGELREINNRTFLAQKIIQKLCNYSSIEQVPSFLVSVYKTSQWFVRYFLSFKCLKNGVPILDEVYNNQFIKIQETYNQIERNSLEQVLTDGKLIEKMNSNATVEFAYVPQRSMHCVYCAPMSRKKNQDIYLLFAIVENRKTDYYAIRQEKNTLTLLKSNGNEQEFSRIVANDSSLTMELPLITNFLKRRGEDYKAFIQRVADIKTNEYIQSLKDHYLNPTGAEKVLDFLKSLVPFYTCIQNINSGNKGLAAFTCSLDVLSLLPVAGVGAKYSSIMWRSIINEMSEQSLFMFAKASVNSVTLSTVVSTIYKTGFQTLMKEILTKNLLKDLTIASLRTLDPGFELSFQFLRFSKNVLGKLIRTLPSKLRNIPKAEHLLETIKSAKNLIFNTEGLADHTGLIPSVLREQNHFKIIKYHYPGGSNYFGPKCVSSFGKTAELRTVEGHLFQLPVVPVKSSENSISYRLYDPTTGEILKTNFAMGEDGILRPRGDSINLPLEERKNLFTLNNYHEYDSELEWMKSLCKKRRIARTGRTDFNDGFELQAERCVLPLPLDLTIPKTLEVNEPLDFSIPKNSLADNIPGTSRNSFNRQVRTSSFHQLDAKRTIDLMDLFKEKGFPGIMQDKSLITFRKTVNSLESYQMMKKMLKPNVELWFTETLTRPSIVNDLKNLKGSSFYFNDLTLLTSIHPTDAIPLKKAKFNFKTEVRYHIEFDSDFGYVDLGAFDNKFKTQYIVFPDVQFFVKDTQFLNGQEILLLKLQQEKIAKDAWLKIRETQNKIVSFNELAEHTRRSEIIEKNAFFVASRTPLKKFTSMKSMMRKYILRMDDTAESSIPTYETLAREIYAGSIKNVIFIPDHFNEWKIINSKFVNDVLYNKRLRQITDYNTAKRTIDDIFDGIYGKSVALVYQSYKNSASIRNNLRFEDYYVIDSFLSNTLLKDAHSARRIGVSLRRLALRQSAEDVRIPFNMYTSAIYSKDNFERLIRLKTGAVFKFTEIRSFYSNREFVLNAVRIPEADGVQILFDLEVTKMTGISDVNFLATDARSKYFVPEEVELTLVSRAKEIIDGKDVFVVKLSNSKLSTEEQTIRLVNRLNMLLATETKYYVNL